MGQIGTLVLGFGVSTTGLTNGLKSASNSVDAFYGKIGEKLKNLASPITGSIGKIAEVGKALGGLGKSAVAPLSGIVGSFQGIGSAASAVAGPILGIGVALGGLGLAAGTAAAALVSGGLDRIDQLGDTAQRLGTSTKALSELRYAADLTGSSSEDLDAALEKLNANLGDSASKATPASEALARIGLDAKALAKEDPSIAFRKIVDGFGQVPDAATKASLAMDIFGKGGVKLLNTLSASGEDLDKLAAEARKFGVSIDGVDQAKIGAAKDALDRAGAAIAGVGNQLAIKLAPFIEAAANAFADLVAGFLDGGKSIDVALDAVVGGVAELINGSASVAAGFLDAFATIAEGAGKVARFLGQDSTAIDQAAGALRSAATATSSARPGYALIGFYEGVKSTAQSAADGVARLASQNLGLGKSMETVGDAIKGVTDKLQEQVATFGKSASEVELYKLAQQGATAEQLAGARALTEQLKGLEKSKKAQDDLENFAKGLKDKTLTPLEKYRQELGKVQEAFDKGLIDQTTFDRGQKAAGKELGGNGPAKFAGALDVNSKEGYSAILAATTGRSGNNLVEKNTGQLVAKTDTSNDLLTRILAAFTAPAPQISI